MLRKMRLVNLVVIAAVCGASTLASAPKCEAAICGPQRDTGGYWGEGPTCQDSIDSLHTRLGSAVLNDCIDEGAAAVCFEQHFLDSGYTCALTMDSTYLTLGNAIYKCEQ